MVYKDVERGFKMLAVYTQTAYEVPVECSEEFKALSAKGEKAFAKFLKENHNYKEDTYDNQDEE